MNRNHWLSLIKIWLFLIAFSFSSCSGKSSIISDNGGKQDTTQTQPGPGKEVYDLVVQSQVSYIQGLKLPSGAIKDNTASNSRITPYFSNFAVMALLRYPTEENLDIARKYIQWYISKLNGSVNKVTGGKEIPGSIYDYYAPDESTKGTYDSIDSYAATFLTLVHQLAMMSDENKEWLRQFTKEISTVATALEFTMDTENSTIPTDFSDDNNDYLSIATYGYPAKYLMDNCEVNLGLASAKWLQQEGLLTTSSDYALLMNRNTISIDLKMWREVMYNIVSQRGDEGKLNARWTTFYPDAIAQLFPTMFGVIDPSSQRAKDLYEKFNFYYSNWSTGNLGKDYPWTLVVYAAAKMKDTARVEEYVKYIYSVNSENRQPHNWFSAEAAHFLSAIDVIKPRRVIE